MKRGWDLTIYTEGRSAWVGSRCLRTSSGSSKLRWQVQLCTCNRPTALIRWADLNVEDTFNYLHSNCYLYRCLNNKCFSPAMFCGSSDSILNSAYPSFLCLIIKSYLSNNYWSYHEDVDFHCSHRGDWVLCSTGGTISDSTSRHLPPANGHKCSECNCWRCRRCPRTILGTSLCFQLDIESLD